MRFQIPISTLFTQVFGIAAPSVRKYAITEDTSKPVDNRYSIHVENEEEESQSAWTSLGTPVQFPMGIVAGTYNRMNKGVIEKVGLPGCWFPFTSVATISRSKRITETYMGGHQGSVIEQYGFESWNIRIQGFIIKNEVSGNVISVEDKVKELHEYESLSDAVELKGKLFEWLKIYRAAIVSINFPEARNLNMAVIKPYEITLKSVEPIELVI